MQVNNSENPEPKKWYKSEWLKRIGVVGFLFFLIKGLIWLAIFFGVFKWFGE
ncbi:MAG: hypothetical protein ACI8ZM_001342 [Crocinitomix sp.]|jgi:hypothetical protein